jgi:glycosyltransferase involved in cell wall biosynthesis
VIVDDRSEDGTFDAIEALKNKDARVKRAAVSELKNSSVHYGKKYALTLGIKLAQYEHMVFTDADCVPTDGQFLERFAAGFEKGTDLILGVGAFHPDKGFVQSLIRADNLRISILYQVFAKLGKPYMGVGRAMGYTKSLFYEVKGFVRHMHILSGDDDLFVQNAVQAKAKVSVVSSAVTLSHSADSFKEWNHQKNRHHSTAKHYPKLIIFLLSSIDTLSITALVTMPLAFVVAPSKEFYAIYIFLFLLKMGAYALINYSWSKATGVTYSIWRNFLFEPVLSTLNALFSAFTLFTKPSGWKRRT